MKYFIALRSQIIVMEESFQTHVLLVLKGPNVNLAIMINFFLEMKIFLVNNVNNGITKRFFFYIYFIYLQLFTDTHIIVKINLINL